jgi:hypothetical protein
MFRAIIYIRGYNIIYVVEGDKGVSTIITGFSTDKYTPKIKRFQQVHKNKLFIV